jgi:hypothetical protein
MVAKADPSAFQAIVQAKVNDFITPCMNGTLPSSLPYDAVFDRSITDTGFFGPAFNVDQWKPHFVDNLGSFPRLRETDLEVAQIFDSRFLRIGNAFIDLTRKCAAQLRTLSPGENVYLLPHLTIAVVKRSNGHLILHTPTQSIRLRANRGKIHAWYIFEDQGIIGIFARVMPTYSAAPVDTDDMPEFVLNVNPRTEGVLIQFDGSHFQTREFDNFDDFENTCRLAQNSPGINAGTFEILKTSASIRKMKARRDLALVTSPVGGGLVALRIKAV